jgi:crotonobetainyl-CoA:carnitine CoA-transferase CaiB-like acyl-CoA transferase
MNGPLDGIVVLDLTRVLSGPHATMMLADLGARVIKVEQPGAGDETRQWGPPFAGGEVSTYFLSCNRNKESITLDLKSDEGKATLTRLIRHSDVLAENFRTGVLDRLGFPVDRLHEINPGLVVLSISGFGHDGPEGGRPGYDAIVQGEAGIMSVTGPAPDQPTKMGLSICDILAGMNGAYGVVAALYERTRTGRGRVVRTSLLASVVGAHAYQGTRWTVAREVPQAIGNDHPSIAPYGSFRCADGLLQVGVANQGLWRKFAPVVGIDPDDPRFATVPDRSRNRADLTVLIEKALEQGTREQWLARFGEIGVPAGSIRSIDEVYEWDQTRSQGLVIEVDHPALGRIELPGPALRFDPGFENGEPRHHTAPPELGQHTRDVLTWLDQVDS